MNWQRYLLMTTATSCVNCTHYYQHYIYVNHDKAYIPINEGHCCYPRVKRRRPEDSCERFERRGKNEA